MFSWIKNLFKDDQPTHYKLELTESIGIKASLGDRAVGFFKKLLNYFR